MTLLFYLFGYLSIFFCKRHLGKSCNCFWRATPTFCPSKSHQCHGLWGVMSSRLQSTSHPRLLLQQLRHALCWYRSGAKWFLLSFIFFPSFLLTIPCFHTNLITLLVPRETSELVIIPSQQQLWQHHLFTIVCRLNVEVMQGVLPSQFECKEEMKF